MKRQIWCLPALLATAAIGCTSDPNTVEVPEGTRMTLALEQPGRSDINTDGDLVSARTGAPVVVSGREVLAEESVM
mgnify:CR=1 FL=1